MTCTHIHTCTHAHTCAHTACTHARILTCTHMCTHDTHTRAPMTRTHAHTMHTCTRKHTCAHTCTCASTHVHTRMHTRACRRAHTHVRRHVMSTSTGVPQARSTLGGKRPCSHCGHKRFPACDGNAAARAGRCVTGQVRQLVPPRGLAGPPGRGTPGTTPGHLAPAFADEEAERRRPHAPTTPRVGDTGWPHGVAGLLTGLLP